MRRFNVEQYVSIEDEIGGVVETWEHFTTVEGYIDMMTGTDLNKTQNAITEESTHILIVPCFTEGITDTMRVVDPVGRYYTITYSDDPVGQGHHNEIYLKYGGVL